MRAEDILFLVALHVPVRCMDCQTRDFVLFYRGIEMWRRRRARRKRARAESNLTQS